MFNDLKVRISARPAITEFDKKDPKTGDFEILPVDPYSYSKGLVNPCGFNANDIYAYENAASDSVADSILHRINTLPVSDVNKDMSVGEKVALCVPRGWCSPAEYLRYCEKVATRLYNQEKAKSDVVDDDKIDFKPVDVPNVE